MARTAGRKKTQSKYDGLNPDTLEADERAQILPPAAVVKALNITPGIKILDAGAGTGFFTFPFAEALGGTGRVFATDIDPAMIDLLKNTVREKGYGNVVPVRVGAEGSDPFYKSAVFDVMFFAEVYHYLWRPIDYFRELRPSLAGDRPYITLKNVPDSAEIEFGDFMRIFKQ